MSLRRRFALVLAAFAVALAATFGYLTWRISSDALEAEMDRRLVEIPRALVSSNAFEADIVMTFRPGAEARLGGFIEPYRARLDSLPVEQAFIFDAVGYTNLVSSDSAIAVGDTLTQLQPHARDVNRALATGESTTGVFEGPEGRMYKYGFVRMSPDEPAVLGVLIPADFFEPLADLRTVLLWGTSVALAVAVAIAGLLAANIARPLERLARVALRIQRGRMDRPVELERGDEIGRLSRAMERMRQGILERDEQLRLMLAQVAHEIRNPLGGLELFASAAAETEDREERGRLLGRVRSEVESLNRIIDDFLIYARPLQIREESADLRRPVREAAELAEAEIRSGGRELEVRLPSEPLSAVVDPDRVKRAVLNLLRNAAQAASRRVLVRAGMDETEVAITVTDDGPGVPEDERRRVFEPFISDKEKGAGLGLAIVRKVVEAQGGRVEVGEPTAEGFGKGAEFRIYFVGLQEPPPDARSPRG
jgi:signal transduction histidine kinase